MAQNEGLKGVESGKIEVNGINLYYEKRGRGERVVLLLPGALGTCGTHFNAQYEGLDMDKLTLVCWDPPGYGKSRPPQRDYVDFYRKDAVLATELMRKLGYDKYSVVGFSDGGRTGLIMAADNPETVQKAVAWGCNAYITKEEKDVLKKLVDIELWSDSVREPLEAIYGDDLQTIWSRLMDAYLLMDDILCKDLPKIQCPVFIFHGERDVMVRKIHPDYFKANIKKCRVHRFPYGPHNCHEACSKEFNQLLTEFLLA
jgi:valacyclovir hydrolase